MFVIVALQDDLTWACNFRPVIRGRPSAKRAIHICGQHRWVFVLVFSAMSFFLWFASCGILIVLWALAIGLLATLIHASFRTPNLKARLNTFREEFRAGPLRKAVEVLQQEVLEGGLLKYCLELGSNDLKGLIQVVKDIAFQYSSCSSKTDL
ncbi:prenylated rab acceptor family protein [Striga asiatica]|uniref:PRA1 family protein n=1 Tax=Striga asiatica TaxID=4170 RepID=A0A5A7QEP9_STRAF|nr:prenylated rab acceptor family protein [Striga asiatica]